MARDLLAVEEKDRDLEQVACLEIGVVFHVQLEKLEGGSEADPLYHRPHLLAEMTARSADQAQDVQRAVGARPSAGTGTVRRRRVAMPAPTTIDTIVSWTRSPVRSGWMPIQATSGKGTGRGGR